MPVVEITAAVEPEAPAKPDEAETPPQFESALKQAVQGDLYKELQGIKSSLDALKQGKPGVLEKQDETEKLASEAASPQKDIRETWLEMKIMLKSLSDLQKAHPGFSQHNTLARLYERLIQSGVDAETARHLVQAVTEELSQEELWRPERVQHSIHTIIENLVQVTGPFVVNEGADQQRPKVVALVGPTGVGKTTTIAKLGMDWKKREKPVTLVSLCDQEGLFVDPLSHYADYYGLPAVKVGSWEGLGRLVAQRKGGELILVDTSGRSHLKPEDVAVLKGLISVKIPLETHLVLSANIKGGDLSDMIDRFSVIPIDSLLFTKIDETQTYGPLLSAIGRKRKPVSYFTTGRRVPEDIEAATPKRFTDLVLQSAVHTL